MDIDSDRLKIQHRGLNPLVRRSTKSPPIFCLIDRLKIDDSAVLKLVPAGTAAEKTSCIHLPFEQKALPVHILYMHAYVTLDFTP